MIATERLQVGAFCIWNNESNFIIKLEKFYVQKLNLHIILQQNNHHQQQQQPKPSAKPDGRNVTWK